ncbi:intraflagellar transport protein 22 homolog isoform X1 [Watersipora subatra]|uniref:intraflagellar transport protein 22 homolog isoform X1 n=1 Tax=Watersipora subatra TaxID=2589382 RepID=UPI00355BA865
MLKLKILVVGPCEVGKTFFSNFVADQSENTMGDYRPTKGVRILEFECGDVRLKGRSGGVEVELWDCSGDHKYEGCWAAMAKDASGIVFIYNPDQPSQEKDLESWHTYFTGASKVKSSQCVLAARSLSNPSSSQGQSYLPPVFSKMTSIKSNIDGEPEAVKQDFNRFLENVGNAMSEKNEQEELNIVRES